MTEHESLRRLYGLGEYSKPRLATGFYPSDGEDEPHCATMPLAGRGAAEDSENDADEPGALQRLHAASDSDVTHSSSPSTRSTQSTGVLHTFHPHGAPPPAAAAHSRLSASSPMQDTAAQPPAVPGSTAAVAIVHAMPHSAGQRPHCDGALHNPRPPDTGQGPLGEQIFASVSNAIVL